MKHTVEREQRVLKRKISLFRAVGHLVTAQYTIGVYKSDIADVEESVPYQIPVNGCPDAIFKLYSPKNAEGKMLPLILHIHGGGWCSGTAKEVAFFARLLASNGFRVANVEYSLAPEYPYPVSTCQIGACLEYLHQNASAYGIDANQIFLSGNSAGAHLAVQTALRLSNSEYAAAFGLPLKLPLSSIAGLLLFNGLYDFSAADSTVSNSNKLLFDAFAGYCGRLDYKNTPGFERLCLNRYITPQFPPAYITTGADTICTQSYEFAEILKQNGVLCREQFWKDSKSVMMHDLVYLLKKKEAQTAYQGAVSFLKERVK